MTYSLLFSFLLYSTMLLDDKPAYTLYNKKAKPSTYKELVKTAQEADVVLFGEFHDNPMSHWLQLQLTKDLHQEKNGKLILGAEMFETDVQLVLNEYLSGAIKESNFEKEARIWDNYKTDYKPLVVFAKNQKIPFIATNIPRRYAAAVAQKGLEVLQTMDTLAKQYYFPPLPVQVDTELPSYKAMLGMMGGGATHSSTPNPMMPNPYNMVYAQAIKDATMAYKITQYSKAGHTFLHYNGAYHSDNYEGIVWYLKKYRPELKIVVITTVSQEKIDELSTENTGKADFTICVPADMTKTY